ncbi:MAG: AI-2E family transporter [Acidobacteriales bacterium]|nr:AI-2E family transporter [Terriglobales bacterium]
MSDPQTAHDSAARVASGAAPRHWALNVLGLGTLLAICYYGEKALAVTLVSILLAFVLAPVVELLMKVRLPRAVAAFLAVSLMCLLIAGAVYFSYNQAVNFLRDLPKYTHDIREAAINLRRQAAPLEELDQGHDKGVLNVHQTRSFTELLASQAGSAGEILLALSFIPFLTYFMLTWEHHVRSATVMLFPMRSRHRAYQTLGMIAGMIRAFMVGNVIIGVITSIVSTIIFGLLGLPFFYFIGPISGYLSIIPYMGVLLAIAPPLFVGIGHVDSGSLLAAVFTVFGLHLVALNVLYPKFLGNRLQLNPLAVTMALLFWAWLWGPAGLLLALPITAAMKIVFDHVESLKPWGAWIGE